MVDQKLVRELLKQLEAEKGCPVQLRADTPESERISGDTNIDMKGREYFGSFDERMVVVKRVEGLDTNYFSDVKLIEGEYESLTHLQRRIEELNALYDYPKKGSLAKRAFQLVQEKTGLGGLVCDSLARNFKKDEKDQFGRISADEVYNILDKAELTYLKHNLVTKSTGVYHKRSGGGSLSRIDETKVADITLKLIE